MDGDGVGLLADDRDRVPCMVGEDRARVSGPDSDVVWPDVVLGRPGQWDPANAGAQEGAAVWVGGRVDDLQGVVGEHGRRARVGVVVRTRG